MREKKGKRPLFFEGWELGVVAVVIALLGTLVAVPLRVAPDEIPLPIVDQKALDAAAARDVALARGLESELARDVSTEAQSSHAASLYDLRALGEALRAYGRLEASAEPADVVRARRKLADAVVRARAIGDEKVLALRAYQEQLFLSGLVRWENGRRESDELAALAGPFLALLERNHWVTGRSIAMSGVLRGIFFKRRWNEVTGLTQGMFALSLDEQRAFYAFLLSHPTLETSPAEDPKTACRELDLWRLRKVEELAGVDAAYPRLLARGVLYYRLGDYSAAAQAFQDHLAHGDGSYAVRARNYLAHCAEKL